MLTLLRRAVLLASVLTLISVLLTANQAAAAFDDDFWAFTTDGCGEVAFVDYGEGAPGGGKNDDYAVIYDNCPDQHGVRARAWINEFYLGQRYDGNGMEPPMVWDPFGNVIADEMIVLEVCLVDGPNDETGARCGFQSHRSVDG